MSTNPWDANFTPASIDTDLVKDVEAAVAAGETAVESVVPPIVGTVISDATGAVTGVIPPAVVTGSGTTTVPGSSTISTDVAQTLEEVIEAAAKGSAKSALQSLAPALEAELAKEFEATVSKVVNRATGGTDVAPVPNLEDFIHADARSRAFRSLLIGLFVAVVTGLGAAAGQLAGADWSTHNGQVAAATIAVGAIATSLVAYVTRLVNEPQVTKPLTAQLPSKGS